MQSLLLNLRSTYLVGSTALALSVWAVVMTWCWCLVRERRVPAATLLLLVLAATGGCVKPVFRTAGTVGPLQW